MEVNWLFEHTGMYHVSHHLASHSLFNLLHQAAADSDVPHGALFGHENLELLWGQ